MTTPNTPRTDLDRFANREQRAANAIRENRAKAAKRLAAEHGHAVTDIGPAAKRTITTRKGRTVETTRTDAEACRDLFNAVADGTCKSGFAKDLMRKRHSLSAEQVAWVHVLLHDAEVRENGTPATPGQDDTTDMTGIVDLLDFASEHVKYPKVSLLVDGRKVVLSRAGDRSKAPGSINITDGGRYGENVWYGRIDRSGKLAPSRQITDAIVETLRKLAADPAGVAAEHGKLTGNCCFCRKELSTDESLAVGYGPVCAKHFNLPWGKTEVAETPTPEAAPAKPGIDGVMETERYDLVAAADGCDDERDHLGR